MRNPFARKHPDDILHDLKSGIIPAKLIKSRLAHQKNMADAARIRAEREAKNSTPKMRANEQERKHTHIITTELS